ncbi:MAG: PEP-CTERM sorting domain-containing protein [Bryobacteraceae bacterium]|nr:PEP-CTERM sorting domain-containing protein [Bryobacteraceae bacterium]
MRSFLCWLVSLPLFAGLGWGYTINLLTPGQSYSLYNTGVDSSGTALVGLVQDPHYKDLGYGGDSKTYASRNVAWRSDITSGPNQVRWITPGSGGGNQNFPAGDYVFYTTFTLPNTFSFWNVSMTALVWADNIPVSVELKQGATLFASFNSFPFPPNGPNGAGEFGYRGPGTPGCPGASCYAGGVGTLTYNWLPAGSYDVVFTVQNIPLAGRPYDNPTGLWVQWQSGSAIGVPEPGTYALMGTVGLALYLLRRRKSLRNG